MSVELLCRREWEELIFVFLDSCYQTYFKGKKRGIGARGTAGDGTLLPNLGAELESGKKAEFENEMNLKRQMPNESKSV